jgi:hypothetical protein
MKLKDLWTNQLEITSRPLGKQIWMEPMDETSILRIQSALACAVNDGIDRDTQLEFTVKEGFFICHNGVKTIHEWVRAIDDKVELLEWGEKELLLEGAVQLSRIPIVPGRWGLVPRPPVMKNVY